MRNIILGLTILCIPISAGVAGELNGALKRISDSGQINLGFRESEPPMSYRNKAGQPVGYSVDLCDHIATAVKQQLKRNDIVVNYVPVTAQNRFAKIKSGKIDILCGATTKTLGRSKQVGFTQLTFVTGASLLGGADAKVSNLSDLKGKRVAVVENTTTIKALKAMLKKRLIDTEVVSVASASIAMAAPDNRQVDAFSSDQIILIGQVLSRKNPNNYHLSKELFSFEPFALALQRGDPDFRLVADSALSLLNRSGQIVAIYQKWFGRFAKNPPVALRALFQLNATPE